MIKRYFNEISQVNQSLIIKNKLILILYIVHITKYFMLVSYDFSYKTRLILFDFSLFIGGIPVFICVTSSFHMILAVLLKILFHFRNQNILLVYWQKLFIILYTNSSDLLQQLNLDSHNMFVIIKLRHKFHIVSKIVKASIISICKLYLIAI